jgi:hypothetical protein
MSLNRRLAGLGIGALLLASAAIVPALAAQQIAIPGVGSASVSVLPFDPNTAFVELEDQDDFVPGDGTPHTAASIVVYETNIYYDLAAGPPTLSSPGNFQGNCGTGTKAYSVASSWPGQDFPSNGPPKTLIGYLKVQFPLDAVPSGGINPCFGFGAVVTVVFTAIGPDEDD